MVIVTRVSTEDEGCNNNILETVRRASHIARVSRSIDSLDSSREEERA